MDDTIIIATIISPILFSFLAMLILAFRDKK